MADLAGLYAALPSAFDAGFAYAPEGQRAVARHALALGLNGLFVGGSTAEVHALSLAERLAQLEDVAAATDGTARLVAHVGTMREPEAHELARAAAGLGYHAVASTPPFYSPFTAAERRAFFQRLVERASVPVFLYHIPSLTGLELGDAEVLDLLGLPGIVGMKLSAANLGLVQRAKAALPDRLVLFGSDDLLGLALAAGADGGVGSTYNLFGRRIVALHAAVQAGDLGRMRTLQAEINRGIDVLEAAGVFPALKAALGAVGVPCGACRPPFGALDAAATASMMQRLAPFVD